MGTNQAPGAEPPVDDRQYGRLYPVARAVLEPIFRSMWRVHVRGLEHVPDEGPAIFCPNHTSVIDSFFLPLTLPRKITFVGKAEYMDDWKTKYLFPAMGMIPIDRGGGSAAERALDTAARVLERGELFGIYPEGTRARDGRLHRGRTGAARLALRTGAPIIPVGIVGTRDIQPPDAKVPTPFKAAKVSFGRPVDPARYGDRTDDRLVLRQMTDEVMFEIRSLTGQEYVDEYASSGRKPAAAPVEGLAPAEAPAGPAAAGNGAAVPAQVDEPSEQRDLVATAEIGPRRSSAEVLARWSEPQGA
jgi:1-acyl-sn-glycerol-3-phosphate acyltransferase